jgi:hypothetical protein
MIYALECNIVREFSNIKYYKFMRKFFIFTLLILAATYSNAQKRLTVSAESGGILPIPVFYKGLDAYSNENHKISASIGFSALISCNWHYDRKS